MKPSDRVRLIEDILPFKAGQTATIRKLVKPRRAVILMHGDFTLKSYEVELSKLEKTEQRIVHPVGASGSL